MFSDINECNNTNTCGDNADCVDSDGSYWCKCLPGFQGDGYNCTGQSLAKNGGAQHYNSSAEQISMSVRM